MKIKTVNLTAFKRFTNLTIDLGNNPKKIIALVGPNGCGKSSVFDAFEEQNKTYRGGHGPEDFLHKRSNTNDPKIKFNKKEQIIIKNETNSDFNKNSFYLRSSYRFTAELNLTQSQKLPGIIEDSKRPNSSIHLDSRLSENYERMYGSFYDDVYGKPITGEDWMNNKISIFNEILDKVLDVKISHLGNHTEGRGTLYFEKGSSKDFPYKNLSSGEKEVIDLILDLFIKKETYNDGYMSVLIMGQDREKFGGDVSPTEQFWKTIDNQKKAAAYESSVSYCGPFEIKDDNLVVHHIDASSIPDWVGTSQERTYKFSANTLTLKAKAQTTATLVWERALFKDIL